MIRDNEIYTLLLQAVRKGVQIVEEHEQQGRPIHKYSDFPEMAKFDSGLPRFSNLSYWSETSPKDYASIFTGELDAKKIAEWQPFIHLTKTHPTFINDIDTFTSYWKDTEIPYNFLETMNIVRMGLIIKDFINRYMHTAKSVGFDVDAFQEIYRQWEEFTFAERLEFDVVVPILFVNFSFDIFELTPYASIERMDDNFQLARNTKFLHMVAANEIVTGAATHALVLNNWSVKNGPHPIGHSSLYYLETFTPIVPVIDRFFAALRATAAVQTGYGQILVRPVDWAARWDAHLPYVIMVFVRAYPDEFENFGWLKTPPILSEEDCQKVSTVYNSLADSSANQLLVASRRLNAAYLRRSEEDSILDITIALEALLVKDGRTGEITHKLATRLAVVCKMEPFETYTPAEVFAHCKKIYDFRSAVAHGTHEIDKKRYLDDKQKNVKVPTVEFALALLRHCLTFFCLHNEFLDSQKLDMLLLE